MIYDFKMLLLETPSEPDPNTSVDADNLYSITDKKELDAIEGVDQDLDNKKLEWFIDAENQQTLDKIAQQCNNIIDAYNNPNMADKNISKDQVAQAILSLIRINQIMWKIWWEKINTKSSNSTETLIAVLGTNQDFINGVVSILWNEKIGTIVNDFISEKTQSINESNQEIDSNNNAIVKLEEILNSVWNWSVSEKYRVLRNTLNANPTQKNEFQNYVTSLINQLCDDIPPVQLNDKFKDDKDGGAIKQIQEAVYNSRDNGAQYMAAWKALRSWMVADNVPDDKAKDKVCDWILGANTLQSLINFAKAWLNFDKQSALEQWWKVTKLEWQERVVLKEGADKIPDDIVDLKKYWTFGENWSFICNENLINVSRDFPNDQFVMIWWERYYLWWISKDNPDNKPGVNLIQQLDYPYKAYNSDSEYTEMHWKRICFWTVDTSNDFQVKTEIIVDKDWNQLKSRIMWPEVKIGDGQEQLMFTKIRGKEVTDGEWENQRQRFEAKWRIEFGDTKKMDESQLDALINDKAALTWVLEQSIDAYKDTMHKPSKVWRYNLSNIIVETLKKDDINRYNAIVADLKDDDRHEIVQQFFGLKYWMYSNPENEIREENQWVTYPGDVKWETVQYVDEENQWDRICNALTYLTALVKKREVSES